MASKAAAKAASGEMTVEMYCVLAIVALYMVLTLKMVLWAIITRGPFRTLGNREGFDKSGMYGRMDRALSNLGASMLIFIPIVFTLHTLDIHNKTTELACKVFVGIRVIYSILYTFGIVGLRSVCWLAGFLCCILLLLQALKSKHVEIEQMMPVIDGHLDFIRAQAKEHLKVEL